MNQVMVNEKTKTTTKLGMCKLMPKMNGDDLYINFCFNMDDHKEATIRSSSKSVSLFMHFRKMLNDFKITRLQHCTKWGNKGEEEKSRLAAAGTEIDETYYLVRKWNSVHWTPSKKLIKPSQQSASKRVSERESKRVVWRFHKQTLFFFSR